LIQRYNLELSRAVLYWSDQLEIEIHDTFKDFWRYLKLFKLMFEAHPLKDGYYVRLEGPISPFVHATTRYGRQFAAFLPALFLCQRWQMRALVKPPQFASRLTYMLDEHVPLVSHFRRSPGYDSRMEADFAADFQAKFGDTRGQWHLTREDEVILLGDKVMIPDFTLTHQASGQRVLIEIVGFWHPEYLRRKLAKVRAARLDNLLLLVYEGVNLAPQMLEEIPAQVLYFKRKPILKDVLAAAELLVSG
jgi:predicted nuclease of restriction endonuclease-like RecB superfamily